MDSVQGISLVTSPDSNAPAVTPEREREHRLQEHPPPDVFRRPLPFGRQVSDIEHLVELLLVQHGHGLAIVLFDDLLKVVLEVAAEERRVPSQELGEDLVQELCRVVEALQSLHRRQQLRLDLHVNVRVAGRFEAGGDDVREPLGHGLP